MKIKITSTVTYDLFKGKVWSEYLDYMDDHPLTLTGLQEFLVDRFIGQEGIDPDATMIVEFDND